MIGSDDFVQVSDDDNVNLIESNRESVIKSTKVIDTIVIDDESLSQRSTQENNNIIEIYDCENTPEKECIKSQIYCYEDLYEENKLFTEYIDKCLDLENSEGMLRIINKNLIKVYREADENYRNSSDFRKELVKALGLLERDPMRKFSNVKNVCETLKSHKHQVKRRAKLITLATNLQDHNNRINNLKRNGDFADTPVKISKIDTIVLDDDNFQKEPQIINLDDDLNDVILLDEPMRNNEEKENKGNSEENRFLEPQVEVFWESGTNKALNSNTTVIEPKKIPITFEPHPPEETELQKRVKSIEADIACYKQVVAKLDEAEVNSDSCTSPYIRSEKLKAKIVTLYKELCTLTGEQPVKRKKIRLQVRDGRPPGPVRLLEAFINNNIGSDGTPPFPDFDEVVQCVAQANFQDGLGWSKIQIVQEASALFTQCGRALQKRRQRREWRDLMATVKLETVDYDPAEKDPELLAKLEENRRIAMKKENDLLERYVMMQALPSTKTPEPSTRNAQAETTISSCINRENHTDTNFENVTPIPSTKNTEVERTILSCNNYKYDISRNFRNLTSKTESSTSPVSCNSKELARGKPFDFTTAQVLPLQGQLNSNFDLTKVQGPLNSNFDLTKVQVLPVHGPLNSNFDLTEVQVLPVQGLLNSNFDLTKVQVLPIQGPLNSNFDITKVQVLPVPGPLNSNFDLTKVQVLPVQGPLNSNLEGQGDSNNKQITGQPNFATENCKSNLQCNIPTQIRIESNPKTDNGVSTSNGQTNVISTNSEGHMVPSSKDQIVYNSGQTVIESESQIVSNSKDPELNLQNPASGDVQPVTIKQEPIDVAALLLELGDNFTSSIIDILDPFLVIEISSDESSDEEL